MPKGPGTYGSKRGRPPKKKGSVKKKPALPKRGQRTNKNKSKKK